MGATKRQHYILQRLNEDGQVKVDQLATTLNVSEMTIHRDLNRLVKKGLARKVHGGAVLNSTPLLLPEQCLICHKKGSERTPVIFHLGDGQQKRACCSHCGLLATRMLGEQIVSTLVTDFLYGRTINGVTAHYVIGSEVSLDCTPSVLAFERLKDAERFQLGFGGKVYKLGEALNVLEQKMALPNVCVCASSQNPLNASPRRSRK
ncbi:MAG: DeoR family transcriptional regulator [Ardenticatenaceae bacterium]